MIIASTELKRMVSEGAIKITPFNRSQIGEGSIDMTLSDEFRIFKKDVKEISVRSSVDYKKYTKLLRAKDIILHPGEFILGITKEKITLPENICGWIQGRSRFARLGLAVHITAGFIHPGSNNRQVFEIYNSGPIALRLHAGERIAQIILEECKGTGKLKGKFKNQKL